MKFDKTENYKFKDTQYKFVGYLFQPVDDPDSRDIVTDENGSPTHFTSFDDCITSGFMDQPNIIHIPKERYNVCFYRFSTNGWCITDGKYESIEEYFAMCPKVKKAYLLK